LRAGVSDVATFTHLTSWKESNVMRLRTPRVKLVPLTIPASVLPKATLMIQSNKVTGATQRLDEKRKYRNRVTMAILPTVMGLAFSGNFAFLDPL